MTEGRHCYKNTVVFNDTDSCSSKIASVQDVYIASLNWTHSRFGTTQVAGFHGRRYPMEIVCVYESNVILTQTDECPRACACVCACVCGAGGRRERGGCRLRCTIYICKKFLYVNMVRLLRMFHSILLPQSRPISVATFLKIH